MSAFKTLIVSCVLAGYAGGVLAQELRFKVELGSDLQWPDGSSLETALGFSSLQTNRAGLRAMVDAELLGGQFELHGAVNRVNGDNIALQSALAGMSPSSPPATLFDLSGENIAGDTALQWGIDRLNLTWTTDSFVFKVARQAITWGNGLVFSPSDVVAPFSPNAIDRSYKTGTDMIYAQYLFDNGADLQAVYIPRPEIVGGTVSADASTTALRGYANVGGLDVTAMLAKDRGDLVFALGGSGALGEGALKGDIVLWDPLGGSIDPSWVVNYSNFASFGDLGFSYFVEAYQNGFGTASDTTLSALPVTLSSRMATGQVFFAGRHFWAAGAQAFVTQDLMLAPTVIVNADDRSALLSVTANYTLGDNTDVSLNYSNPFGADGTEFGGRETSLGSGNFVGPSRSLSLTISHFF